MVISDLPEVQSLRETAPDGNPNQRLVGRSAAAELVLRALPAEHRQLVVNVEICPPLVSRVLVVARLAAALGAEEISV